VGAVLLTSGLGLLSLLKPDTNYGVIVGFMLLFGTGIGMIFALVSVTLQNSVEAPQMGVVMSAFSFFQLMGGSIGVAIVGALMNTWTVKYYTETPMNPALATSRALDNVFTATIVPGCIVIILSLFIRNVKIQPHAKHVEDMDILEKGPTQPVQNTGEEAEPKQTEQPQDVPVQTDTQVEQALAEARGAIERKKSKILAQQELVEREERERESERESERSESQQKPKSESSEETEEEMEKRIREKIDIVERERELEAQRQREAEVLERAAIAIDG